MWAWGPEVEVRRKNASRREEKCTEKNPCYTLRMGDGFIIMRVKA
jgi:hypothetical protein